jgi:hypothetical protein
MRNVKVTLAAGIALTIAGLAVVLTRSPPRVVHASAPRPNAIVGVDYGEAALCQIGETLPAGVTAIRLAAFAFFGLNVRVVAYRGSQVLTEGSRGPDWTGGSVTVPVEPLDRTTSDVRLCFVFAPNQERILILGWRHPPRETVVASLVGAFAPPTSAGAPAPREAIPLRGRVVVQYLAAGHGSWWSRVLSVARRMGIGHVLSGTWLAGLVAALVAAVGVLSVRLALRELP